MIKADSYQADMEDVEVEEGEDSRIDALAKALGFSFVDGAYVKAASSSKRYARKSTETGKTGRMRHGHSWKKAFYLEIFSSIPNVGQETEVTDLVRAVRGLDNTHALARFCMASLRYYGHPQHFGFRTQGRRLFVKRLL